MVNSDLSALARLGADRKASRNEDKRIKSEKNTMTKTKKIALLLASLIMSLAFSNCEGIHAPHVTHAQNALMCDKCKATYVLNAVPGYGWRGGYRYGRGAFTAYYYQKVMVCPDCEDEVVTFLKTGNFKHRCSSCGGTMTRCELQR